LIKATVLSVVLSASCPPTKLIGFDAPLTEQETQSLNHAKKRCAEIYPDSPCLKSFEKREEQVFWAICGAAE
jgi:hypothetical protein